MVEFKWFKASTTLNTKYFEAAALGTAPILTGTKNLVIVSKAFCVMVYGICDLG
jgi:hypothetical protein